MISAGVLIILHGVVSVIVNFVGRSRHVPARLHGDNHYVNTCRATCPVVSRRRDSRRTSAEDHIANYRREHCGHAVDQVLVAPVRTAITPILTGPIGCCHD
jgi:hypothetical protein